MPSVVARTKTSDISGIPAAPSVVRASAQPLIRLPRIKLPTFLAMGKELERRIRSLRKRWSRRLASAEPAPPPRAVGCNVVGYLRCEMGVAEAARGGIRALQAAETPHSLIDCSHLARVEALDDSLQAPITNLDPYNTNLLFVNADQTINVQRAIRDVDWKSSYNIGFWHWELEEFPDEWRPAFCHVNEIWVASSFVQKAISAKAPCPVVNIGLPIHVSARAPERGRFGIAADRFVFLASCDLNSFSARKNPLGAIQAFEKAFGSRTDVELVVKASSPQADPTAYAEIRAASEGRGNIRLLTGLLRRDEMLDLLGSADCYVSLHRSEGFGLGLAESMALGKPVIGTAYSGNLDFMRSRNSGLVDFSRVALDRDHGPYRQGEFWADPDLDHAAWWMRQILENAAERSRMARAGQHTIQTEFSDVAIGQRCRNRLHVNWSHQRTRAAA